MSELKTNALELTVSELSQKLKRTVEETFGHVRVRGEISGFRGPHSSGHCYFSIKDERARLEAVIWRGVAARLKFMPEEGLEMIASGKLTTYPGSSKYQIVIDNLEPAGAGALMALLEERRKKLAAEGLFDENRKQLLPFMPQTIGVITSPTGAVIRDILHRLADRFSVRVLVWPVRVQGETSGAEVANGVRRFNEMAEDGPLPRPDVIIVARGGGSLEDLWGFNDEGLVRAAAGSMIPLISAVGHETDWTLVDHAADWRAPTPTAAAEKAVPVKAELESQLADLAMRLNRAQVRLYRQNRSTLRGLVRALPAPDLLLALPRRRFDEAAGRLSRALTAGARQARNNFERVASRLSRRNVTAMLQLQRERLLRTSLDCARGLAALCQAKRARLEVHRARLDSRLLLSRIGHEKTRFSELESRTERAFLANKGQLQARFGELARMLRSLSHQSVLDRGFALIRDAGKKPLTTVASMGAGMPVAIEMHDGQIGATINGSKPKSAAPKKKTAQHKKPGDSTQGSLFDRS